MNRIELKKRIGQLSELAVSRSLTIDEKIELAGLVAIDNFETSKGICKGVMLSGKIYHDSRFVEGCFFDVISKLNHPIDMEVTYHSADNEEGAVHGKLCVVIKY